jgi:hypothetical protein
MAKLNLSMGKTQLETSIVSVDEKLHGVVKSYESAETLYLILVCDHIKSWLAFNLPKSE